MVLGYSVHCYAISTLIFTISSLISILSNHINFCYQNITQHLFLMRQPFVLFEQFYVSKRWECYLVLHYVVSSDEFIIVVPCLIVVDPVSSMQK